MINRIACWFYMAASAMLGALVGTIKPAQSLGLGALAVLCFLVIGLIFENVPDDEIRTHKE